MEIIHAIISMISAFFKGIVETERKNKKYIIYISMCILISIASYFLNIGWIRMFVAPLPALLLLIIYWRINRYSINLIDKSNKLYIFVFINGISLLLSNFLLSDYSDAKGYAFFGQIDDSNIISLFDKLFPYMLIFHLVLMVSQFIYAKKIKNRKGG